MSYQDLIYSVDQAIATITLNRPARMNALSANLEEELHRAFDEAEDDRAVRVIILTGAGAAFCAGFDQGANKSGRRNSDPAGRSIAEFIEYCHRRQGKRIGDWQHMWRLSKPIIAAVNGWAMGAGFWYQLAADITIASDQAVFAQPEVRHISSTSFLLTALCGWKAANRWALTGDHFDAQEALRIGMVNEVVPHAQLMDAARALAKRIALVPEPSVRLNKAVAMLGIQAAGLHSGLLLEGTLGALAHASHNEYREKLFEVHRKEGVKAYLDMRDGPFQPEPMGPRSAKARAQRIRGASPSS
jgi:enoyl-CoA hydratase/carnithine racemase